MLPPGMDPDYALVRQLPLFEGVGNEDLIAAMQQGGIRIRRLERDMFVLDPIGLAGGAASPVIYVAEGQVAAAVFMENELHDRRNQQLAHEAASKDEREAESLIKPPPLARVALKNVALFMEHDLFNSGALSAARGQPIAFYTSAPSSLLQLEHRWIAELAARYPVFETRVRRALSISRERLAWVSGVKQELLDFFVRQGISVSGEMVRVRQLDLCIDCKLCEEACEDRYGARRLTLGGYQIGMLDFIYTCRTCTDQRCVDPCAYDSIKFDENKREVVINESTCTGVPVRCDRHDRDRVRRADVQEGLQGAPREEGDAVVRTGHAARRARTPDREQVRSLHRVWRSGLRVCVPDRLADRGRCV
jgi:NAD-dependent dihydropyrimidine dehydrogenase PreA subunit